jgi:(2Fe-2S) ferredoxin
MSSNGRIRRPQDLEAFRKEPLVAKGAGWTIRLCAGAGCIASGEKELKKALEEQLVRLGLAARIIETGCMGPCAAGPVLSIEGGAVPGRTFYEQLRPEDAADLLQTHCGEGRPLDKRLHRNIRDNRTVTRVEDMDFFKGQEKIVLRNCGSIDPCDITDYFRNDGYAGLGRALSSMNPEAIIKAMEVSGLRGRGGAGFPTWLKWKLAAGSPGDEKYVLCNADEGDPGAFMDRSVLEGDPHSVIEGMIIAARAVGARQGYVYVRAEYPLAVARLKVAIDQARLWGLLGGDIMGSGFAFDLGIRMGSGAFVCGEETALMNSIEGRRGEPRPRPPFPAQSGLWGKPTVLNNVETYANVAPIILRGPEWYIKLGTERAAAQRSSPWPGRSATPVWWRCPSAPTWASSSSTWAAESRTARPSRRPRSAAPRAAAFPNSI